MLDIQRAHTGPTVFVRVMSYNVHRCIGIDRRLSVERIAEVIASCHPDIVGLQELDSGGPGGGRIGQAEIIARDLGMDLQFFPTLRIMEEHYGDAILSRLPARLVKAGALPTLPRLRLEPRGAIWSSVDVGGSPLQVINTHFGLFGRERLAQAQALLGPEWLEHPECSEPAILLGDFNAPPGSRAYRRLRAHMRDAHRIPGISRPYPTYPTRYPALRLDHIFISSSLEVLSATTVRTPLARLASDHLPIVAELQFAPARPAQQGREAVNEFAR